VYGSRLTAIALEEQKYLAGHLLVVAIEPYSSQHNVVVVVVVI
jgi:hypothetical protein